MNTIENLVCSSCNDPFYEMSDIEGYEHLCIACASYQIMLEIEEQWETELQRYNKRAKTNYDIDQFCLECLGENPAIDKTKLRGLVELKRLYDDQRNMWFEYSQPIDPQYELNFSGLPF